MIFDPSLDTSLKYEIPSGDSRPSAGAGSFWLCYPGQPTSHLHKAKVLESLKRFRHVGYPGSFRQPEYQLYLRNCVEADSDCRWFWQGSSGRVRVNIDGGELDITRSSEELTAGKHELLISLDYAECLPALSFSSDSRALLEGWQVSLDRKNWTEPEMVESLEPLEDILHITPSACVSRTNARKDGPGWILDKGGEVILDFAYYELGTVLFEAQGEGEFSVVVGQSIPEVQNSDESAFEQRQADPFRLNNSEFSTYETPIQVLRYVRLQSSGLCRIRKIVFKAQISPVEHIGRFSSSDERLNAWWAMGAATVHSCMHGFFLDAAYRDALPWAFDGMAGMMASNVLFNDRESARRQVESQLLPEGSNSEDLGVLYLDFQLYAIWGFEHEYQASGDRAYLLRHVPVLCDTCDIYLGLLDENGFLSSSHAHGMTFFPDWAVDETHGPDLGGSPAYAQMLLYRCLEFCSFAAGLAGDRDRAVRYSNEAEQLAGRIKKQCWDDRTLQWLNGYHADGSRDSRVSVFAQTFGALFGLTPPEGRERAALLIGTTECRPPTLSISFPFQMMALALLERPDLLISFLDRMLTPLLEKGYKRIWEDLCFSGELTYDFYGRPFGKSLCHGVLGAAPVLGLQYSLLGLRPRRFEPGVFDLVPPSCKEVLDRAGSFGGRIAAGDGFIEVNYQNGRPDICIRGQSQVLYENREYKENKE